MADSKISALTALTGAGVDSAADLIPIVDSSAAATKSITPAELLIGIGAQPLDATLTALAGLSTVADKVIYATGVDTFSTAELTSLARTLLAVGAPSAVRFYKINADNTISLRTAAELLSDIGAQASGSYLVASNNLSDIANAATARTNLGVAIGTDVQAYNSNLTTWAGKTAPSGIVVGSSDTQTLTNKRVDPRLQSVSSSATVTPDADSNDAVIITAQAAGLTLANPSGTPVQGQPMIIRIKDNGTARSISYGTQYRAIGVTLPTTTVISKTVYMGFIYNSNDTKWDCIGVSQEA